MTIKIDIKESTTTVIRVMEVRKRTTRSALQKIGDTIASVKEDFASITGTLRILAVTTITVLFTILTLDTATAESTYFRQPCYSVGLLLLFHRFRILSKRSKMSWLKRSNKLWKNFMEIDVLMKS